MNLNLTGRAARWSAAHWKTACLGWLAFVAVAVAIGDDGRQRRPHRRRAVDGADGSGRDASSRTPASSSRPSESVLISSPAHATTDDPAFRATIARVVSRLQALPEVDDVHSPLDPAFADQLSKDRHSALVEFDIRGAGRDRRAPGAARPRRRGRPAASLARLHRRGARRCEREPRARRHDRQGLPAGRAALAAADVPDPAARVRRVRRRLRPGAARLLGRPRVGRAERAGQPRLACVRRRPRR